MKHIVVSFGTTAAMLRCKYSLSLHAHERHIAYVTRTLVPPSSASISFSTIQGSPNLPQCPSISFVQVVFNVSPSQPSGDTWNLHLTLLHSRLMSLPSMSSPSGLLRILATASRRSCLFGRADTVPNLELGRIHSYLLTTALLLNRSDRTHAWHFCRYSTSSEQATDPSYSLRHGGRSQRTEMDTTVRQMHNLSGTRYEFTMQTALFWTASCSKAAPRLQRRLSNSPAPTSTLYFG